MSQATLDVFLAEARKDLALSDEVRAAKNHEELMHLAQKRGHQLSKASVIRHHLHRLAGRSDQELESMGSNVFDSNFGDIFLGKFI